MLLEICCYNIASAIAAQKAGAHRVELCADPAEGGTTPAFGIIKTVRKKINILDFNKEKEIPYLPSCDFADLLSS